ncbi:MAG: ATP-binding protein [Candidatus Azotimanducaceae bacterium]
MTRRVPDSIQRRLLLTTSLVLLIFLGVTGWVLDQTFSRSVIKGAQEQLQLIVYSLMGSASEKDRQLQFADNLAEPRLAQPDSGLYAFVSNDQGELLWRSRSAVLTDVAIDKHSSMAGSVFVFSESQQQLHPQRFSLSHAVTWEGLDDEQVIFTAVADQVSYRRAIQDFRQSLGVGLASVALVFLVVQALALRWGLTPLLRMHREVGELEKGEREQLSEGYPIELQDLAINLQRFVNHEQNQRRRYSQALDNLAHSLKTPLSVISNALSEPQTQVPLLRDQVQRMQDVVANQLNRATLAAPLALGSRVSVEATIGRLVAALRTAYPHTDITASLPAAGYLRGDSSDLLEIFGNVLENACKFSCSRVAVSVETITLERTMFRVIIEDDGPGIAADKRAEVLKRGQRADSQAPGQGIGLSVAAELVALYQGELVISEGENGGARICITLPGFPANDSELAG